MKRLWRYLEGRKAWAAVLLLVGVGNAACQTGGWLLVRDAIDNGIRAGNEHRLTVVVAIYLGVAAVGWGLQGWLIRGLAGARAAHGARPAQGPLRPPDEPLAPLLLAAEGRLDHRATHLRRGRRVRRALAGDADARRERDPAAGGGDRAPDRRLAARSRRLRDHPARTRADALVPAHLSRRARRDAQPHRRRHRADRRVGLGHGGRAGVQPRIGASSVSSTS